MDGTHGLNRRYFLRSGAGLGALPANSGLAKEGTVYHFSTPECDIRMTVEFYNRYSSKGFWFGDRTTGHEFCLSASGERGHNCVANFSGSLAIARYTIRSRFKTPGRIALRESVRTIDRDSRLGPRPPFERTLEIQAGVASDIQAFGYEANASPTVQIPSARAYEPWCLLRQDLYFDGQSAAFLVVHWKHTPRAISLLDVVPGDDTRWIERGS